MIVIAGIATFLAVVLTVLVIVFSQGGVGYATVYASWIVTAILWLGVVLS